MLGSRRNYLRRSWLLMIFLSVDARKCVTTGPEARRIMMSEQRLRTPTNLIWAPRPGWATVRLVGTCADRTLRRGQVVLHTPSDDYDIPGQDDGLVPGTLVIILHEAARLVEDDLHLVPEHSIVAIGEALP